MRGTLLKHVSEFKYLGAFLRHDEPSTGDTELNYRIQIANAKFFELSNLLENFTIHLKTRIMFLNSFVRSRLTYACQNWNLNTAQYDRLDAFYRKLLRKMIRGGFKRIDRGEMDFRYKVSNVKLHTICKTNDVSTYVKEQQFKYASHVVRMSLKRGTKQLMFNNDKYTKVGRHALTLLEQVVKDRNTTLNAFCSNAMERIRKST